MNTRDIDIDSDELTINVNLGKSSDWEVRIVCESCKHDYGGVYLTDRETALEDIDEAIEDANLDDIICPKCATADPYTAVVARYFYGKLTVNPEAIWYRPNTWFNWNPGHWEYKELPKL